MMSATTTTTGPRPPRCTTLALVDAHFDRTISPAAEHELREHLTLGGELACKACHARYRRHLLLAKLAPDPERSPEARIGHGLGFRAPIVSASDKKSPTAHTSGPVRRRRSIFANHQVVALAATLALAALLFLVVRSRGEKERSFTSRGGASSSIGAPTTPAPAIAVFRISTKGETGAASTVLLSEPGSGIGSAPITRNDELAFAYTNAAGKTHLMIFGVDETQRVYWFHPAWTNENENPTAIRISTDREPHELHEAIRHPFEGHRLTIHGLFVDHPLTVRDAETAVRSSESGQIIVTGAVDHVIMLEVSQ